MQPFNVPFRDAGQLLLLSAPEAPLLLYSGSVNEIIPKSMKCQKHEFVITQEALNGTANPFGLSLNLHCQVNAGYCLISPVKNVTNQPELIIVGTPISILVD